MNAVVLREVCKFYGQAAAVDRFTLAVQRGRRVAVLGPSGCGKTTLLRLVAGLEVPDRGEIELDGQLVAAQGKNFVEPERRNVGMVFQDLALWPHLSVRANLEFGLKARGVPPAERARRVDDMLQLVQLERYANSRPEQLSGGEQQRVALARALVLQPRILLMDEPLSNLDPDLRLRLRQELVALHERLGFTLLYVTHDRDEAFHIGEEIVVMNQGTVAKVGTREQMRSFFAQAHPEERARP